MQFTEVTLISTDRFLTTIPVVGTVTNIVKIFLKAILPYCFSIDTVKNSLYLTRINATLWYDHCLLAIPIVGSIIIIYFRIFQEAKIKASFAQYEETKLKKFLFGAAYCGNTEALYLLGYKRLAALYGHRQACRDITEESITRTDLPTLKLMAKYDPKACAEVVKRVSTQEYGKWVEQLKKLAKSNDTQVKEEAEAQLKAVVRETA